MKFVCQSQLPAEPAVIHQILLCCWWQLSTLPAPVSQVSSPTWPACSSRALYTIFTLEHRWIVSKVLLWHRRADRGMAQQVWKAWHGAVVHHAHVKQTMANAILRICHRSTAAAFEHWQDHVAAIESLQQHAVQRMQKTRLHKMCMLWRALAAVKQQHKVSTRPISPVKHASFQLAGCVLAVMVNITTRLIKCFQ